MAGIPDFGGQVIAPGDSGYDEARALNNAMWDKKPALIARCATTADVVAAVNYGRKEGLDTAVRCGGHHGAGLGSVGGGVVIHLSGLKSGPVDPKAPTVRPAGGNVWGEDDRETGKHGLAAPSGIISTTGVGGLTLGGGIGHLTRKCGLSIDNILEAEVVLADGSVVTANESENSDLYWGIRGGGGNFGVVTSFLFRLHDVPGVVSGPTFWAARHSAEVF